MRRFLTHKFTLLITALLLLVAANIGLYQYNRIENERLATEEASKQISIYHSIIFSNTNRAETKMDVPTGATALEALERFYTVKKEGTGTNAFVTSINERAADPSKKEFWAFYVNGKQAEVGAGSYQLQPEDKIVWKIETY